MAVGKTTAHRFTCFLFSFPIHKVDEFKNKGTISLLNSRAPGGLGGQVLQAHQVFAKPKSPIVALFQRNSVFSTLIEVDLFYVYPVRSGRLGSNLHPSALCLGASTPSSRTQMVHGFSILLSSPFCSCHRANLHEAYETLDRRHLCEVSQCLLLV